MTKGLADLESPWTRAVIDQIRGGPKPASYLFMRRFLESWYFTHTAQNMHALRNTRKKNDDRFL